MPLYNLNTHDIHSVLHTDALRAPGVFAETKARYDYEANSGALLTSGTLLLVGVYLPVQAISTIAFISSATALTRGSNADSHLWNCIVDTSMGLLAITADDTSTAWAANSTHPLNIANIASGASSTYTPPAPGFYYVGLMVAQGTGGSPAVPTLVGESVNNGQLSQTSRLVGNSSTLQTTPPGFPTTFTAIGAPGVNIYPKVQIS